MNPGVRSGSKTDAADRKKKAASMLVFERLLGVMTEDRFRRLSPEKMKRLARRRIRAALVQLAGISAEDLLGKVSQKSKSERRPSCWKDCFT